MKTVEEPMKCEASTVRVACGLVDTCMWLGPRKMFVDEPQNNTDYYYVCLTISIQVLRVLR